MKKLIFVSMFLILSLSVVYGFWCNNADINRDGSVDVIDQLSLAERFGDTDCNYSNSWCNRTDINNDGAVDVVDLLNLVENWAREDCTYSFCSDTDGLNISIRGSVNSSIGYFQDYCESNYSLMEYSCRGDLKTETSFNCTCSAGRCI